MNNFTDKVSSTKLDTLFFSLFIHIRSFFKENAYLFLMTKIFLKAYAYYCKEFEKPLDVSHSLKFNSKEEEL